MCFSEGCGKACSNFWLATADHFHIGPPSYLIFFPVFFKIYLLKCGVTEKRERQRASICWFTFQKTAMAGAGPKPGVRKSIRVLYVDGRHPSTWPIFQFLDTCISREMDWKLNSWDSNQRSDMDVGVSSHWLSLLHHNASP